MLRCAASKPSSPDPFSLMAKGSKYTCEGFKLSKFRAPPFRMVVSGTDADNIIAQMSELRVTKWSLFGDEFSNHLREAKC